MRDEGLVWQKEGLEGRVETRAAAVVCVKPWENKAKKA
jgi:hypothetical protein